MKLYELLNESISLTRLKKPLEDAIYKTLSSVSAEMPSYKDSVPEHIVNSENENGSLGKLQPLTEKKLVELLHDPLAEAMQDVIVSGYDWHTKPTVRFKKINSSGSFDTGVIKLSDRYLEQLVKPVCKLAYDTCIDNLNGPDDKIVDRFFWAFTQLTESNIRRWADDIGIPVYQLVSTTIHETVHAVQHDEQHKKGRNSWDHEYRSYLEKDKYKFWKSVNHVAGDAEPVSAETLQKHYKLYRASPQEIAAFSHEAALNFVHNAQLDDASGPDGLEFIASMRSSLHDEVPQYLNDMFGDPTNRKEYPIFKRFSKQVYQEIIRALDYTEKRIKKEELKRKKEAEYQKKLDDEAEAEWNSQFTHK